MPTSRYDALDQRGLRPSWAEDSITADRPTTEESTLLERIPGRGTFVARPRRTASRITSYSEEMTRRGMLAESQTLLARREQAGPGVARALNISEGDAVIHWRRLRRGDGAPVCIEDAYLNEVLLPGFL